MKPRSLKTLLNLPAADRNAEVSTGLSKLAEHVSQLHADANALYEVGRPRGSAIIDSFAAEQAAAFLILLDLIRDGWNHPAPKLQEQIKRFYGHRQRGMYMEAYGSSPADLAEIEQLLEHYRKSHFLDGPNDVDWVFRNEIDAQRESMLYVDYVATEEGTRYWESPADRNHDFRHAPNVIDIVESMNKVGLCTREALDVTAQAWDATDITDRTLHWQTVLATNRQILAKIELRPGITDWDTERVARRWIHPLNALDMSPIEVSPGELAAIRAGDAELSTS